MTTTTHSHKAWTDKGGHVTSMSIPKSGAEHVEMIRMLKVAKDSAIDCRTKAINQIRALLVTAPPALRERLAGLNRGELISTCAAFRSLLKNPATSAKTGQLPT